MSTNRLNVARSRKPASKRNKALGIKRGPKGIAVQERNQRGLLKIFALISRATGDKEVSVAPDAPVAPPVVEPTSIETPAQ